MEGTRLRLRVAPGSRRPGIAGRHDNGWKLRVAQPPEDGRANGAVVGLFTDTLALPRGAVRMVSGHPGRDRIVAVEGTGSAHRLPGERSSTG